jgi:hypothetical protein
MVYVLIMFYELTKAAIEPMCIYLLFVVFIRLVKSRIESICLFVCRIRSSAD